MIAIPNMDKPKECIECEFSCLWANGSTHCMVDGEELFCDGIPQRHDCPLIDIVRCGECKWWDKDGDRPFGYCHAEKHRHFSTNWEISIYRKYKSDHFCSDGERRMIWE